MYVSLFCKIRFRWAQSGQWQICTFPADLRRVSGARWLFPDHKPLPHNAPESGCQQTRDLSLFIFAQVSTTAAWRSSISVLTDGGGHQAAELGCSRMAAGVLRSAPRQRGRKYADGSCGSAERRAGRFAPRPGVLKMKFMNVTAFHISSPLLARAGRKNPSRPWAELLFSVFRP